MQSLKPRSQGKALGTRLKSLHNFVLKFDQTEKKVSFVPYDLQVSSEQTTKKETLMHTALC